MNKEEISIQDFPLASAADAVMNLIEEAGVSAPRIFILATDCYGKVSSTSNLDVDSQLGLLNFALNAMRVGSVTAVEEVIGETKQ